MLFSVVFCNFLSIGVTLVWEASYAVVWMSFVGGLRGWKVFSEEDCQLRLAPSSTMLVWLRRAWCDV